MPCFSLTVRTSSGLRALRPVRRRGMRPAAIRAIASAACARKIERRVWHEVIQQAVEQRLGERLDIGRRRAVGGQRRTIVRTAS